MAECTLHKLRLGEWDAEHMRRVTRTTVAGSRFRAGAAVDGRVDPCHRRRVRWLALVNALYLHGAIATVTFRNPSAAATTRARLQIHSGKSLLRGNLVGEVFRFCAQSRAACRATSLFMSIEAPAQYSVGLRLFQSEFRIRSHADKDVSHCSCILGQRD